MRKSILGCGIFIDIKTMRSILVCISFFFIGCQNLPNQIKEIAIDSFFDEKGRLTSRIERRVRLKPDGLEFSVDGWQLAKGGKKKVEDHWEWDQDALPVPYTSNSRTIVQGTVETKYNGPDVHTITEEMTQAGCERVRYFHPGLSHVATETFYSGRLISRVAHWTDKEDIDICTYEGNKTSCMYKSDNIPFDNKITYDLDDTVISFLQIINDDDRGHIFPSEMKRRVTIPGGEKHIHYHYNYSASKQYTWPTELDPNWYVYKTEIKTGKISGTEKYTKYERYDKKGELTQLTETTIF